MGAITLDGQTVPMPKGFAGTVMKNAFEESVVGKLTPSEPLPLGDYIIPQYDGGFEVGVVGEGKPKPVSEPKISHKVIKPIKLAGIIIASKEAAKKDPVGMFRIIQQDMINAISRGVDYCIMYGKSPLTGTAIADAVSVNQTTNRVELAAGDLVPQILAGYDLAAAGSADPNGFAFDSRLRAKVAMATQQVRTPAGVPQPMPNLAVAADTVAGLPAAYGRVVAGRIGTQADSKVRGFVGDWAKVRWGYAENISVSRSTEATVVDGGNTYHLWQDNLVGLLVECIVGWTILDLTAFAAYEDQV